VRSIQTYKLRQSTIDDWVSELRWQLWQHSGQNAREITQGTEVSQGFSSNISPKRNFAIINNNVRRRAYETAKYRRNQIMKDWMPKGDGNWVSVPENILRKSTSKNQCSLLSSVGNWRKNGNYKLTLTLLILQKTHMQRRKEASDIGSVGACRFRPYPCPCAFIIQAEEHAPRLLLLFL